RLGEILLAEMEPIGALVDREAPVVVHDERRAMPPRQPDGLADTGAQLRLGTVPAAQLHESHAEPPPAGEPLRAVEDRVEAGQYGRAHERKALPISGVEGAAMSRGSMGSARQASWPARAASAKPCAIRTGSPALATAVLTSTAS